MRLGDGLDDGQAPRPPTGSATRSSELREGIAQLARRLLGDDADRADLWE